MLEDKSVQRLRRVARLEDLKKNMRAIPWLVGLIHRHLSLVVESSCVFLLPTRKAHSNRALCGSEGIL